MNNTVRTPLTFSGRGIGHGSAIGKLNFYRRSERMSQGGIRRSRSAGEETQLLRRAIADARDQLSRLYDTTHRCAGENEAQIFEIHRMLLEDDDFLSVAESLILDGYSAAYAVSEAAERYSAVFASIEDDYLSARAADLRDVASRVASILQGGDTGRTVELSGDEKYIIAASDLTPSETVQLDRDRILGFVTFAGSPNSHTAILARALGIPALIGTGEINGDCNGADAIIDADSGLLYVNPDNSMLARYRDKQRRDAEDAHRQQLFRGRPTVTRSGRRLRLYANIGNERDAALALQNDAEGIGLLRSEFLYLESDTCPDEETIFNAYRETVKTMSGRPVIIRTLDIGADKQVSYLDPGREENPALGLRGVRLSLASPELFRTQLRAICRASAYGPVSVMVPMISVPHEVLRCREILEKVQSELAAERIPFDAKMPFGIMLETPAAAVLSAELARMVDFFSVGTNDLIQYTLAADRQNPALSELCESGLEPVLRLVATAAENAHAAGIWLGICGELAANPALTQRFIDIGVDELSVSPPYVLPLRERIADCN